MDFIERNTIKLTPYRRRYHGLCVGEIVELKQVLAFIAVVQGICAQLVARYVRFIISYANRYTCSVSRLIEVTEVDTKSETSRFSLVAINICE